MLHKEVACRGVKYALLIGINYTGTEKELKGASNDVRQMQQYLDERGFTLMILTEQHVAPTRDNMLRALREAVRQSREGAATIVIQFSGHGTLLENRLGAVEWAMCTVDGLLVHASELNAALVDMSPWCTVFLLVDACHSGSGAALPLRYPLTTPTIIYREAACAPTCNALMISGCRTQQKSTDRELKDGTTGGAMTQVFFNCLKLRTVFSIVTEMQNLLRKQERLQRPQITTSHVLHQGDDINTWLPT